MGFRFLKCAVWFALAFSLIVVFHGCALLVRTPAYPVPQRESSAKGPWRGVFHVHTKYSHDSKASLENVAATGRRAGLDFVVVTDHNTLEGKKVYQEGAFPRSPLLIFGNEISSSDGHLIALGPEREAPAGLSDSQALIRWIHENKGYAILAHPVCRKNPWRNLEKITGYDGLEIYNFSHSFYPVYHPAHAAKVAALAPGFFLKSFQKKPEKNLALWDEKLKQAQVAGFGAIDAHIHLRLFGITPENYLLWFQSVTTYALAGELEERGIIEALGEGRSFTAFEAFGLARDFIFEAVADSPETRKYGPGERLEFKEKAVLRVKAPEEARLRILRDGNVLREETARELLHETSEAGAYRAEVYKGGHLWIVSNPVYLKREA